MEREIINKNPSKQRNKNQNNNNKKVKGRKKKKKRQTLIKTDSINRQQVSDGVHNKSQIQREINHY